MSLKDTLLASIESELEVLKSTPDEAPATPVAEAAPVPAPVTPEPDPVKQSTVSPLHDMILAQANERFARDTYFKN